VALKKGLTGRILRKSEVARLFLNGSFRLLVGEIILFLNGSFRLLTEDMKVFWNGLPGKPTEDAKSTVLRSEIFG
jgi:hypothetical protein